MDIISTGNESEGTKINNNFRYIEDFLGGVNQITKVQINK